MNDFSYKNLYNLWKKKEKILPSTTQLRLRRAFSWWEASEKTDSLDEKFIFLWIMFNAIYSIDNKEEINSKSSKFFSIKSKEMRQFEDFLDKVKKLDTNCILSSMLLKNFTNMMRVFIHNKWVFNHYWEFKNDKISEKEWKREFFKQNKKAATALVEGRTSLFMGILFSRLYVLRNQIMHGAATYEGSFNRDQVRDGSHILSELIPIIVYIILENKDVNWGNPYFLPSISQ